MRRALKLIELMPEGRERLEQELHAQNRLAALLTMTRGQAHSEIGRVCARARELSAQVGHGEDLIATLWSLLNFHCVRGDMQIAAELAEQLMTIGEEHGDALALSQAFFCRGLVQPYFGRLADALESFVAAVQHARTLPLSLQIAQKVRLHPLPLALAYTARCAWIVGDVAGAAAAIAESVRLARELDHSYTLAFALFLDTQLAALMADPERTERCADEFVALSAAHGFAMLGSWARLLHGWAIAQRG